MLYPYVYFTKLLSNLSSEQETFEKKGNTLKHYDTTTKKVLPLYQMKVLVLVLVVGVSQPALGGIFTRSKCTTVPSNLCAVVYDDEKCNGWALNINEGEVDIF